MIVTPRRLAFFFAVAMAALLSLACLDEGPVLKPGDASGEEEVAQECQSILGKAFASPEQRQWFIDNCSEWPQRDVPDAPPPTAAPPGQQRQEPEDCARIRGRPYESEEQRRWFLANCLGGPPQPAGGPDRNNCDEIRGTQYRSPAERDWYRANCMGNSSADQAVNRANCQEISGTRYRSEQERAWFEANCLTPQGGDRDDNRGRGNGRGRD